jgi:hypothetical protein
LSVFARNPFPSGRLPYHGEMSGEPALRYAKPLIWTNDTDELIGGEGETHEATENGLR